MWERRINFKRDWNSQNSIHDDKEYRKLGYRKSEEEEKSLNIEKEMVFPVSIFFVEIQDLVDFLVTEGFFIDHISLRFKDNIGQGIKTYYAVNPQIISDMINSNQIFDIEEIVFMKFLEKIQVKIRLDSITIVNGSISLADNIKKFIRQF